MKSKIAAISWLINSLSRATHVVITFRLITFSLVTFSLVVFCTACGWRVAPSVNNDTKRTVSIPYVEGDASGFLTQAVVEQIEKRGGVAYVPSDGDLLLQIRLADSKIENIGFRHDPSKLAEGEQKLIPNESRKIVLAEITVTNSATGQIVLGPLFIKGRTEYDHQHYALDHSINIFSLGQLTDVDTAREGLEVPSHRALAKEIADLFVLHFQDLNS